MGHGSALDVLHLLGGRRNRAAADRARTNTRSGESDKQLCIPPRRVSAAISMQLGLPRSHGDVLPPPVDRLDLGSRTDRFVCRLLLLLRAVEVSWCQDDAAFVSTSATCIHPLTETIDPYVHACRTLGLGHRGALTI